MPTLYWLQMALIHSTKPFNVVNLACDVAQLQPASLVEHEEFFVLLAFLIPGKQSVTSEVYMEHLVCIWNPWWMSC
jgi:hypothetical protein